jgi:hypothetical protein
MSTSLEAVWRVMAKPTATTTTASTVVEQEVFVGHPSVRHLLVEGFIDPTRGMVMLGSMEAGVHEEGTRAMVMVLGGSSGQWTTGRGMATTPYNFLSRLRLQLSRWEDRNSSCMGVVWQVHHRVISHRGNIPL